MELQHQGMPPDDIDRKLRLVEGTAHDAIVDAWKADTEAWAKSQRERKKAKGVDE